MTNYEVKYRCHMILEYFDKKNCDCILILRYYFSKPTRQVLVYQFWIFIQHVSSWLELFIRDSNIHKIGV